MKLVLLRLIYSNGAIFSQGSKEDSDEDWDDLLQGNINTILTYVTLLYYVSFLIVNTGALIL